MQLARHRAVEDQFLAGVGDIAKIEGAPRQPRIEVVEGAGAGRIDEDAVQQVEEIVSGRAMHSPIRSELFIADEDLFDHGVAREVRRGSRSIDSTRGIWLEGSVTARLQVEKVLHGVKETVRMVDAQALDAPLAQELEGDGMDRLKDLGLLDTDGRQIVDVEEPTIIDLVGCHAPVAQAIWLVGQKGF